MATGGVALATAAVRETDLESESCVLACVDLVFPADSFALHDFTDSQLVNDKSFWRVKASRKKEVEGMTSLVNEWTSRDGGHSLSNRSEP